MKEQGGGSRFCFHPRAIIYGERGCLIESNAPAMRRATKRGGILVSRTRLIIHTNPKTSLLQDVGILTTDPFNFGRVYIADTKSYRTPLSSSPFPDHARLESALGLVAHAVQHTRAHGAIIFSLVTTAITAVCCSQPRQLHTKHVCSTTRSG